VYESRDPDYIFEEDYDDDEEPVEKQDISPEAIKKEVKQDLKENIVMNIDDETVNNIKNMKEFKMKILEKKQAKNMTYLPGGVNLVKDIIPTRKCAKNISYN
jgi:flagellar biosynthesis protein FliP